MLNRYSETWSEIYEDKFNVEVKRWTGSEGDNIWNIYVYLYKTFPNFHEYKDSLLFSEFPVCLYRGITYSHFYRDEKEVYCKKYGCDFNHIDDSRFLKYTTKTQAWEVFQYAEKAYSKLVDFVRGAYDR